MRKLASILLLLATIPANAAFLTYSQWARLPPDERTRYIAGAFDSLVSVAPSGAGNLYQEHYSNCLYNAQMSDKQLADNVMSFASTRPELQGNLVTGPLIKYLISLCGQPGN